MKMSLFIPILVCCLNTSMYAQTDSYGKEFTMSPYSESRKVSPKITPLVNGEFIVCWTSAGQVSPNSGWDVFARMFDSSGKTIGEELQVNTLTEGTQWTPAAAGLQNGGFVVCWDGGNPNSSGHSIFGQIFDPSGARLKEEIQVSTNPRAALNPTVASLKNGGFVVVWGGVNSPIYGHLFDEFGNKVGEEFTVPASSQSHSGTTHVENLQDGGFVVCWKRGNIYGQIYNSNASKRGAEFQVNSTDNWASAPRIVTLSDGTFKIFWEYVFPTSNKVHYQKFDVNGAKIGNETQVIDPPYIIVSTAYTITSFTNDNYTLCWFGSKGRDYQLWSQRFDASGNKQGYLFRARAASKYFYNYVSSLKNNSFIACWEEEQTIKGKLFPYDQPVPREHDLVDFSLVTPANDSAMTFTIPTFRWKQPSTLTEIYDWEITFDLYIDTDANFSNPQTIKNILDTTYIDFDQLQRGNRYFWKVIAKNARGDSLLCNEQQWSFYIGSPNSVEQSKHNIPTDAVLQPNYPNPFNASTTIQYEIPESGHVNISIYNMLGEKVATLLDNKVNAGSHSVVWHSKDKPSGIYLVRLLLGEHSQIRKIVLQK